MKIPHSDYKQVITEHFDDKWQANWNEETSNKLHKTKQKLKKHTNPELNERDNVKYTRLIISPAHLTHSFLLLKSTYALDAIRPHH